jgi:hypothetical protein
MIIREILSNPREEILRFDFFNDYKDTMNWLKPIQTEEAKAAILILEKGHDIYLATMWPPR